MATRVKKSVEERAVTKEDETLKEERSKEKRRRVMILSLAVISIAGFALSLLFLLGITGAAIGPSRGNLWGMVFIIISLLIWAIAEMLWVKGKREKEVDIKKLLEDVEKEGIPMFYKKSR